MRSSEASQTPVLPEFSTKTLGDAPAIFLGSLECQRRVLGRPTSKSPFLFSFLSPWSKVTSAPLTTVQDSEGST